jgi:uncharacterized protein YndB with AHSA1/START domain
MKDIQRLKSAVRIYRAFDIRIEIDAVIAKVFDALTTSDGLNSWWTHDSKADPREGGELKYIWHFGRKSVIGRARYRSFDLPHSFKVDYLEWIDHSGHFRNLTENPHNLPISQCYELHEISKDKTSVCVLTSGMSCNKIFDALYEGMYDGWINSLVNLKSVCETGLDLRSEFLQSLELDSSGVAFGDNILRDRSKTKNPS